MRPCCFNALTTAKFFPFLKNLYGHTRLKKTVNVNESCLVQEKKAQVALHEKGKEREGKKNKDVNLVNFRFHV